MTLRERKGWSFMAFVIRVPFEELTEIGMRIQGYADDNQDIFDQIGNSLEEMNSMREWFGHSNVSAVTITQQNIQKYHSITERLYELGTFLQDFSDEMQKKDNEIQKKILNV